MTKAYWLVVGAAIALCCPLAAQATVKPAALFSDHMVLLQDVNVPVWGWADPAEKVTVTLGTASASTTAGSDGRWMVRLPKLPANADGLAMTIAGRSNTVTIDDVLVGEVWLASGQSNMDFTVSNEHKSFAGVQNQEQEIAAANYPQIRMFTVDLKLADQPQSDVTGHWAVCSPQTVGDMSAAAYFFAREIHQDRHVPVGIIDATWGASTAQCWTSRETLVADPVLKPLVDRYESFIATWNQDGAQADYKAALDKWQQDSDAAKAAGKRAPRKPGAPKNPHQDQHNPYLLYNGMIDPVKPYAIRGAIWYQGESNGPTADIYLDIMQKLVTSWRAAWGEGDFPFIEVQLAAYGKPMEGPVQERSQTARVRQAQLDLTKTIPAAYMATAVDIGNAENIHPKNKQEVGRRLGLIARSQVYGETSLPYSGPLFSGVTFDGGTAVVTFTHAEGGLEVHGASLDGFAVSADGTTWQAAVAKIVGDTVVVSCDRVAKPTAVRYAWGDNPSATLYNKAGLPASPFGSEFTAHSK